MDLAIAKASNYETFKNILTNLGYDIIVRAGKLSIRGKDYKRNIRIERYFGEDYSIDNINKQIKTRQIPITDKYRADNNLGLRQPPFVILSSPNSSIKNAFICFCCFIFIAATPR